MNVRNSNEFYRSRFSISDGKKLAGQTGIELAHVQRKRMMSWPQNGRLLPELARDGQIG